VTRYWPLFDLRLTTPDLELTTMREADLPGLADSLPDDLEQDPAATTYAGLDDRPVARGVVVHQGYWKAFGTWSVDAWRLNFVVRQDGAVVGVQELEGNDFPTLRVVDTSSYLVGAARGRGWGKQMRAAVLALAFGPLGARAAITSAWHDNHASLGVSRSLGYTDNGESYLARPDGDSGADVLVHLRMTRAQWDASGLAGQTEIHGFAPCRPFFGLG
jgi:RimJ/RimL family protein N-acetyltransferase